jgi:hypothetical protein
MMTRSEEIRALRAGEPLPAETIIARRAAGIHAIRRECIIRMLQSGVKAGTLDIAWDDTEESSLSEKVTGLVHRLIFRGRRRVVGRFPDLWRLCYPDDEELKAEVDKEIERMVDHARKNAMEDLGKGGQ